jgi:hypothetical protein
MWPLPDSSSAVHFRLALIPIPEYALGIPFSQTLSTKALNQSTFGWFDAPSCKTTPEVQLTTVSPILFTACRTINLPSFCFSAHYVVGRDFEKKSCQTRRKVGTRSDLSDRGNPRLPYTIYCAFGVLF